MNWVHLDVEEIVYETDRALLLRLAGGEQVWVPRSQVADPEDYQAGDVNCTVSVSEWFASKEGLS
jgi:hypothetical protein